MKQLSVPVARFDLAKFVKSMVDLWGDPNIAFPVVGKGMYDRLYADFDIELLDDFDKSEWVNPDDPVERLEKGQTLFAQFFQRDEGNYIGADGTELEDPLFDEDEDDDEEGMETDKAQEDKQEKRLRDMIENTYMDECSTYGFLIEQKGDNLLIQTAVLRDVTGECIVEAVDDAGFFEKTLSQFIDSLTIQEKNKAKKKK